MKIAKFKALFEGNEAKLHSYAVQLEDGRSFLLEVRPEKFKTHWVYDAEGNEVGGNDYKLLIALWKEVRQEDERKKRVQILKDAFAPWQGGLRDTGPR